MPSVRATATTLAAIGAAAFGGAAIAGAADPSSSTTASPSTGSSGAAAQNQQAPPAQRDPSRGGHQANGKTEVLLTGDTATKVEAAAKAKVPGGTIERVETDVDTGSPYEAHVRKSDGSEVVVYVNKSFEVTSVDSMQHP
jgi:hypothetical protein